MELTMEMEDAAKAAMRLLAPAIGARTQTTHLRITNYVTL